MIKKQSKIHMKIATTLTEENFSTGKARNVVPTKTAKVEIISPPRTKPEIYSIREERHGFRTKGKEEIGQSLNAISE